MMWSSDCQGIQHWRHVNNIMHTQMQSTTRCCARRRRRRCCCREPTADTPQCITRCTRYKAAKGACSPERSVHKQRAQEAAADADGHDGLDRLACHALPLAAAHLRAGRHAPGHAERCSVCCEHARKRARQRAASQTMQRVHPPSAAAGLQNVAAPQVESAASGLLPLACCCYCCTPLLLLLPCWRRTFSLKALILSSTSHTSGTTLRPASVMTWRSTRQQRRRRARTVQRGAARQVR